MSGSPPVEALISVGIGKYVEVDTHVKEIIEQYVSGKGLHREKRSAVVMWWKIRKK